jgi:two-component system sensor histidine kinase KdpD
VAGLPGDRAGGRVQVEIAAGVPLVRVDPRQLERVIANLVDNAVKFSPAGRPVEVSVAGGGVAVAVSVRDHGPGIPEGEREHVFEPFHRLDSSGHVPGSGLGLAIARGLAEANGCRLELAAAPGGGSVFTLTIPVAQTVLRRVS